MPILTTWIPNNEKNIEECLKSICNESKNFESEIIVIDDGSIDKTSEIVKKFKTIKLIKLKKILGLKVLLTKPFM